jgi:hypothetical protein
MANEFYYCVSLSIVHPTIDPIDISNVISNLQPRIESMAGSERRTRDGTAVVPARKVLLSHWLAELHDEERIFSGDEAISDFITGKLRELEGHRDLFSQLGQEGQVSLVIGWFSESNHSAGVLEAETLKKCGDLGLSVELNYYGPSAV